MAARFNPGGPGPGVPTARFATGLIIAGLLALYGVVMWIMSDRDTPPPPYEARHRSTRI